MTPLDVLKYHVTGAIERGEKQPIVESSVLENGVWKQFKQEHADKRKSVTDAYDTRYGRIISPGKFEGEPIFAPYYWQIALEGFADTDNGVEYGFRFRNGDADFTLWPELKKWLGRKRTMRMSEDSVGFVRCR